MKVRKRAGGPLAAVFLISVAAAQALGIDQPNMQAARNNLNKAENALRKATPDKGGHRQRALDLIAQAISEVNQGIAYDRETPGDRTPLRRGRRRFGHASAAFDQPNMQEARNHLQNALAELQRATADKGGHRAKAIDLTREAIEEVNKGIAYDRRN